MSDEESDVDSEGEIMTYIPEDYVRRPLGEVPSGTRGSDLAF
jgi:hypothetical protein